MDTITARFGIPSAVLVLLLLCVGSTPAWGQQPDTTRAAVTQGKQVKVWADGFADAGEAVRVQAVRPDSLMVSPMDDDRTLTLPWNAVERLEVRGSSRGTYLWEGALIGTGAGAVAYGIASGPANPGWLGGAAVLAAQTVLPGAVLGGLIGSGFSKDEWMSVQVGSPPAASSSASPVGGLSVSVHIPLPVMVERPAEARPR